MREVKFKEHAVRKTATIQRVQAECRRYLMQEWLMAALKENDRQRAATLVQAHWRGWLARRFYRQQREELLWPIKSWFEYTATGADSVQVEVAFLANPDFDDYDYFLKYGTHITELRADVQEMQEEVEFSVEQWLADERSQRPATPEGGWGPPYEGFGQRPDPVEKEEEPASTPEPTPDKPAGKASAKRRPRSGRPDQRVQVEEGAPKAKAKSKANQLMVPDAAEASHLSSPGSARGQAKRGGTKGKSGKLGTTTGYEEQSTMMPTGEVDLGFGSTGGVSPGVSPAGASMRSQSTGMAKARSKAKSKAPSSRPQGTASAPSLHVTAPAALDVPRAGGQARGGSKQRLGGDFMDEAPESESVVLPAIGKPKSRGKKPSPRPERESKPLFDTGVKSEAHVFLQEAPKKWVDINPEPRQHYPKPPPSHSPSPPSPSSRSVAVAAASSKAAALRASQSEGAIEGVPGEGDAGAADAAGKPAQINRQHYGGKLVGKTFVRNNVDVEKLGKKEQEEVLADIAASRALKEQELVEKRKLHKERRKKEADDKLSRHMAEMNRVEAEEAERQKKKAKELKKWLKRKEEESKARKARDEEIMEQVMQQENEKSEQLRKLEKLRLEERERRLRIAEKQKAKLEAQMLATRADRLARIRARQGLPMDDQAAMKQAAMSMPDLQQPMMEPGQQMPAETMPAEHIPHEPIAQQMPLDPTQSAPPDMQEQPMEPGQVTPSKASMMPGMPTQQRVVHRHIHHHVHYHEGADMGSPSGQGIMDGGDSQMAFVDLEQRRQIEMQSEARVRAQLEAAGQAPPGAYGSPGALQRSQSEHFHQHHGPGQTIDPAAETPTNMRRMSSMSAISGVDRTQEAFHRGSAAALAGNADMDLAKRRGLHNYGGSVGRAFSSYADSGRPRYARPAIVQDRSHAV